VFFVAGAVAVTAAAHPAAEGAGGGVWSGWSPRLLVLAVLLGVAGFYGAGLVRLRASGGGRSALPARRAAGFAGGMLVLAASLLSPIDHLAEELSWVHVVQHMLLMNVAAPLLVVGMPFVVGLWALPRHGRRAAGHWKRAAESWNPRRYLLWQPLVTWALFALTLWVWHLPRLYEAALDHRLLHDVQHVSFLAAACLFWRVLLDPVSRLRLSRGVGVVYLFATSLHASLLGLFMALAPRVWYSTYAAAAPGALLTPIEDQQLAGLIMWMPACMIYAVVAALLFGWWLRDDAAAAARVEPTVARG
jgi:putative membrane protein